MRLRDWWEDHENTLGPIAVGVVVFIVATMLLFHDWRPDHSRWAQRDVCDRSHEETTFVPQFDGKGNLTYMMPITSSVCDASHRETYCEIGKDEKPCI